MSGDLLSVGSFVSGSSVCGIFCLWIFCLWDLLSLDLLSVGSFVLDLLSWDLLSWDLLSCYPNTHDNVIFGKYTLAALKINDAHGKRPFIFC